MIDCLNPEVRDALPDLIHGRLSELDTAILTAHVESCGACRAELALLREVQATAPIAPWIDITRVASALPASGVSTVAQPTEAPRSSRFSGTQSVLLKLVAAAAIVIAGTLAVDAGRSTPDRVAVSAPVASESVLSVKTGEPASASLSLLAGVQDLTDEQIETLLADIDVIEPLPAAEPEPAVITVDNVEVTQ